MEAVVLRHQDWGEADRLVTLFSREFGKLRAVAKGARKARSRKAGHLQPFTRVKLLLARGREMLIVTQAETISAYLPLCENLELLGHACYLVELLDRFTYEDGEHRAVYRLLTESLDRLSKAEPPALVVHYYEVHLLDALGFRPQLFLCVRCQSEIEPEDQFFSNEQGGVLCPRCGRGYTEAKHVSMGTLKYLRYLQRSNYLDARRVSIPPIVNREMDRLLQGYLTYLLERSLNTPTIVLRLLKEKQ